MRMMTLEAVEKGVSHFLVRPRTTSTQTMEQIGLPHVMLVSQDRDGSFSALSKPNPIQAPFETITGIHKIRIVLQLSEHNCSATSVEKRRTSVKHLHIVSSYVLITLRKHKP